MKEQHLFRGKRVDNGEWVEGWYCMNSFGKWPLKAAIIPAQQAVDGCFTFVQVDPDTVGRYTGLPAERRIKSMKVKDKHGNEHEKANVDRDIEVFSNTVQDLIEISGCCDFCKHTECRNNDFPCKLCVRQDVYQDFYEYDE